MNQEYYRIRYKHGRRTDAYLIYFDEKFDEGLPCYYTIFTKEQLSDPRLKNFLRDKEYVVDSISDLELEEMNEDYDIYLFDE